VIFEIFKYKIPFKKPLKVLSTTLLKKEGFILKVTNAQNQISYGEITPFACLSEENLSEAFSQLKEICYKLKKHIKIDKQKLYPSVLFGVTSALNFDNEEFSQNFAGLLYHDFDLKSFKPKHPTYKVKLSELNIDTAISLIKIIKQKFPTLKLRLDINQKWTYLMAIKFLENFQLNDFEYLEEPCKDPLDTKKLLKTTNFPIALDESLNFWSLDEIISYKNIKALIIKPSITNFTKFIKLKIPLVFSSTFETGIGLLNIAMIAKKYSKKDPGLDTYRFLKYDVLKNPLTLNSLLKIKKPFTLNKEILKLCTTV
jgi:o-succinylbenzoate synthase